MSNAVEKHKYETFEAYHTRISAPKMTKNYIFWLFIFSSFVGFLVEIVWCVYRNGHIEWRGSLMFGPLNFVYGVGALCFYFSLRNVGKSSVIRIIFSGMVCGSIVEYGLSWLQEKAIGTVSWDYSEMPFNIEGRICLLYSFFWGILALFWVYYIHPMIDDLLMLSFFQKDWIRNVVLIFVLADSAFSVACVLRWTMRLDGKVAMTIIGKWIDQYFPNDAMTKYYPNMRF